MPQDWQRLRTNSNIKEIDVFMKMNREVRIGIVLFLLPAMILFVMFFLFPIGYVAVMSLFRWNGMTAPQWNSFGNYISIFQDKVFWMSLRNNIIWHWQRY